jgi:hypothetical protein
MNSRNSNAVISENSPAADEVDTRSSSDPTERFLARKAKWRSQPRRQSDATSGDHDLLGRSRGDTSSEAFSPSSYGLK